MRLKRVGIAIAVIIVIGISLYPTLTSSIEDYQESLRPTECATVSDRLGSANAHSVLAEAQRVYGDDYASGKISQQPTVSRMDMYRVTYCWYTDN